MNTLQDETLAQLKRIFEEQYQITVTHYRNEKYSWVLDTRNGPMFESDTLDTVIGLAADVLGKQRTASLDKYDGRIVEPGE